MNRIFHPYCSGDLRRLLLAGILSLASLSATRAEPSRKTAPRTASELFQLTNLWTVHLKFTAAQWKAMEPEGGGSGRFGGPGAPGGRGGFGPAMFIAPTFLKGDRNHDGALSKEEFRTLGEAWFSDWDKEKSGKLSGDQLRAGLDLTLAPTNPGPPGAGGGPAGRPPGMNLQGAEGKRNGLASAAGIEFKYVHADLEFAGQLFQDVAVRYKGNGTWMQSQATTKRSLKLDLNEFVKGQKLAGISKLNLHNSVTDPSWMNEVLSHRLFRDAGVPAPLTAYARVYVSVPGQHDKEYLGLYSLVEDIDRTFAEENFGTKKGAIFKPVTPNLFAYLGDSWAKYQQTYDPKTDLTDAQSRRIIEFSRLVRQANDPEFASQLGAFLDLEEFARFMAVTVWLSTLDSILGPGQNYYVHLHPKTGRFQFMPWDLDHSFGQFPMMGSQEQRETLSIHKPWRGENRFLERVFNVEGFKTLYLAKLREFSQTVFQPEKLARQVDEVAAAIRPSVQEESKEKLARFNKVVAGESVEAARFGGGGPTPGPGGDGGGPRGDRRPGGDGPRFGGPGGSTQPVKPIKSFVTVRAQSVLDQLAGKSEGQTTGEMGFGGRGGRGGGPGRFLGDAFMTAFDANEDKTVTHDEFTHAFARWFETWNTDQSGLLTEQQLRAGINQDLAPFRGGPPGGPGFGPPGERPPGERPPRQE